MKNPPQPVRCALSSPWGAMTLAATDTALVWSGFDGQKHEADTQAWQSWLLRLESLRYAASGPNHPGDFRRQLATLHNELKHLHWPK